MDSNFVHLKNGINLTNLMSEFEFQIDSDFNKQPGQRFTGPNIDLVQDDEESELEDIFSHIADKTEGQMLSCPEYESFEKLGSTMVECDSKPPGAVKIRILEEGDGPLVSPEAQVLIHYAAYFENSRVPFDSSLTRYGGAPWRINLREECVAPGVRIALCNTRGRSARLLALLAPAAAWGRSPALYVIRLLDVLFDCDAGFFNSLPTEEQRKYATTLKTIEIIRNTAKGLFKKKRYTQALMEYQRAVMVFAASRPETEEQIQHLKDLKIKIFVNMAVCYAKLGKPKYVLRSCDMIDNLIDIETHCKALFYKGKAYELMDKSEEALIYYKKALKLEPKNKEIGLFLAELEEKNKKSAAIEVDMWQKAIKTKREEKIQFNVDDDFKNGALDMCQDLAARNEYSKFDLPNGLTNDEVLCLKHVASQFEGLIIQEDGEGQRKRTTIIKKVLP